MIQAITFDFWDTLVADDSDEPKRKARGLLTKSETRLQLLSDEITRHHSEITRGQITAAFKHANDTFNHAWKVEHHTPTVATRLKFAYEFLQIGLTPGFANVVRAVEEMEVAIPPDFCTGVNDALAQLARQYKLGIVSDTIHTPGRGIRQLLEAQGILEYFSHCVFSDEVGASKPKPIVFERASAGLGVPLAQIAHVGDRESNDVDGPLALGMCSIFFTGVLDRGSDKTRAHAVCKSYADLPGIIARLNEK
ncbi:MAG: HAD family hydrolase [Chloroflexi bacterium]|nr:HAD family hydrolase [Chloroflexota bacterium]